MELSHERGGFGMKELRNQKGFTLIELAIVLVIIGIIIGAILKGQDLIDNARHKRFANDIKKFEVAAWTHFDRKGYFPGDSNRDGKIEANPKDDLLNKSKLDVPADNKLQLGSYTFYVFFGNDGTKNIIAVTNNSTTAGNFSDDELEFMKAFDTAIDGVADGTSGRVQGASNITLTPNDWFATVTSNNLAQDWTSSPKALVYFFDRRP